MMDSIKRKRGQVIGLFFLMSFVFMLIIAFFIILRSQTEPGGLEIIAHTAVGASPFRDFLVKNSGGILIALVIIESLLFLTMVSILRERRK